MVINKIHHQLEKNLVDKYNELKDDAEKDTIKKIKHWLSILSINAKKKLPNILNKLSKKFYQTFDNAMKIYCSKCQK